MTENVFRPHVVFSPDRDGDSGEGSTKDKQQDRLSRSVEQVALSERPEIIRWRVWRLLENILDEGDGFTSRNLKDSLRSKVIELEESIDPYVIEYEGRLKLSDRETRENKVLSDEFKKTEKDTKLY